MSKRISFEKLKAIFPRASQSFLALNGDGLASFPHSAIAEPDPGSPLVSAGPGEEGGSPRSARRFKIVFRVRSCQPCDWDNYRCKELQDLLVHAGVLPCDDWCFLQGEVIPEKVDSHEEEGTLIEVFEQEESPGGCGDGPSNPQKPRTEGAAEAAH